MSKNKASLHDTTERYIGVNAQYDDDGIMEAAIQLAADQAGIDADTLHWDVYIKEGRVYVNGHDRIES
jgi:hypothetical protein